RGRRLVSSGEKCLGSTALVRSAPASAGDVVTDTLFDALYSELHRLARRELARRSGMASLSVTTLLHEAYLDIAAREDASFSDEAHFLRYAARVMRGIIVDHARSRGALKRGGEFALTSLDGDPVAHPAGAGRLSLISDVLDELAKVEPE